MSDLKSLTIENLVHRLNNIAQQRKALLDKLWTLETETEKLRIELMGQLLGGQEVRRDNMTLHKYRQFRTNYNLAKRIARGEAVVANFNIGQLELSDGVTNVVFAGITTSPDRPTMIIKAAIGANRE